MNCGETVRVIRSVWFLVPVTGQLIAGFISIVLSIFIIRKCSSLYFHSNTKVLLVAMLYLYIVHSLIIIVLQTNHLIQYFFADPCTIGTQPVLCFCLRFSATCCFTSLVTLQSLMVVERAVALWKRQHYESYGPKLGIIFVIFSVIISPIALISATQGITYAPSKIYCTLAGGAAAVRVTVLSLTMCGLNLVTLLGVIALFFLNGFLLKRKRFNLKSSYQLSENATIIRIILPLIVFQTISNLIFSISATVFPLLFDKMDILTVLTLLAIVYTIPYYTVVSPILMWFTIRWSRQLKESKLKSLVKLPSMAENDFYFRTYENMWNK